MPAFREDKIEAEMRVAVGVRLGIGYGDDAVCIIRAIHREVRGSETRFCGQARVTGCTSVASPNEERQINR